MRRLAEPTNGTNQESVIEHGIDISRRIVYLHGDISRTRVTKVIKHLRYLDAYQGEIVLDIASEGGDVQAGLMLVDAIRFSTNRIIGVVSGMAESMAFVVLQACSTRAAYPWATISFHQGLRNGGGGTNYDESLESAKYDKDQSDRIDRFVHARGRSREPFSQFQINVLKSMYMSATKALDEGWLDEMVKK